jgi:hypothetical protein
VLLNFCSKINESALVATFLMSTDTVPDIPGDIPCGSQATDVCSVVGDPHIIPFSRVRFSSMFTADTTLYSSTMITISATATTAGWSGGVTQVNGVTVMALGIRVGYSVPSGFDTSVSIPGVEVTSTQVTIECSGESVRINGYRAITISGHMDSTTGLCTFMSDCYTGSQSTGSITRPPTWAVMAPPIWVEPPAPPPTDRPGGGRRRSNNIWIPPQGETRRRQDSGCPAEFRDECEFDLANSPTQMSSILEDYDMAAVDRENATAVLPLANGDGSDGDTNNVPFIVGMVVLFCVFVVTGVILFRCLRKHERKEETYKRTVIEGTDAALQEHQHTNV